MIRPWTALLAALYLVLTVAPDVTVNSFTWNKPASQ